MGATVTIDTVDVSPYTVQQCCAINSNILTTNIDKLSTVVVSMSVFISMVTMAPMQSAK